MIKNCFIISPIGAPDTEIRRNADLLFAYILEPILEECGFKALRADMIPVPGMISPEIIRHIVEDDLAIADLTGMNPNVFYELAIRHVIGKPYIHLIREGEIIPFDVKDIHTITYSIDVQRIKDVKEKIKAQIGYFEANEKVLSPFTMTMNILSAQKAVETEALLQELLEGFENLSMLIKSVPARETDHNAGQLFDVVAEKLEFIRSQMDKGLERIQRSVEIRREARSESRNTSNQEYSGLLGDEREKWAEKAFKGFFRRATPNTFTISEYLDRYGAGATKHTQNREESRKPQSDSHGDS